MDPSLSTETFTQEDHSWLGSADGLRYAQPCTIRKAALTEGTHYPSGYIPSGTPLARYTSGDYAGLYCPVAAIANEVQTLTVTGAPTGGTFTVTCDGETTAAIAYNATAATVQAALLATSKLDAGDVTVTGSAGGPFTVTFGGRFAGVNVPAMTTDATGLTGGTTPGVTVATGTGGGSGVSDGSDVLAGYLAYSIRVGASNPIGALLERGRIIEAKLPIAVTANQKATAVGRFIYR